ncbi:MAG: threonine--tRNA ligase [[Eubacterium] siraeum]|nr:threonine--tRNA ligase [[Eubacterium] siraeum]
MMEIKLKDGNKIELESAAKAIDAVKQTDEALAKAAIVCKIDGKLSPLDTVIDKDCELEVLTFDSEEGKQVYRHTCAHILAQAVKNIYPTVQLAIGPAIDNGFYYDFDFKTPITQADFDKIEAEMKSIIKANLKIKRIVVSREEAEQMIGKMKQTYKMELLADIPEGEEISFYQQGDFIDLCSGPHMLSTGKIKAFKLTSLTGAYWRGNEKNKMLTRIYGTAFTTAAELDEYVQKLEEAKSRDHNKLGRELGFFMTDENIGQGLPLIMPKGARVLQIMQRYVEDEEQKRGYLLTKTPIMTKNNLFITSGHWEHYKDKMFYIGEEDVDDEILCLRPMTCPLQFTIYKNGLKSYRDLPVRYAETATEFRKEASGEMHGLTRIRQFTLADGHIVCTPDQLEKEFEGCVDLIKHLANVFGIANDIWFRFSRWDPDNADKYVGTPEEWNRVETTMKTILDHLRIKYEEAWGEAAFYGPKLDVQGKNVHGKEDTLFTVQIYFSLAKRFDMIYIDENGEKATPLIIHRSSIGCYERTLGMLIEKYNGAFPMWLAPEQVRVLSLTDRTVAKAKEIVGTLTYAGMRATADVRSEKLGKKIREAQLEKVPYILVVGDKEAEQNVVSVRHRSEGDLGTMSVADFIGKALLEIATKKIK